MDIRKLFFFELLYTRYYLFSGTYSILFFISPFRIIRQFERISYRTSVGVQAREKWRPREEWISSSSYEGFYSP